MGTRPPRVLRSGPDPARRLKRNYELLVRKVVGGESPQQILIDTRISSRVGPKGRRGRPPKLRSVFAITQATRAFLRQAPGDWSLIFPRNDWHTALREQTLPLPSSLHNLVEAGDRDWLIRRLHFFEMRSDNIARVTGASVGYVRSLIGATKQAPLDQPDSTKP